MAPHFEEAARIFKGQVVFLKMNADECSTPATLGVRGIPALHLFLDGHPVSQQAGLMTTEALGKWINSSVFARSRT
jgi:thioredoxin 1